MLDFAVSDNSPFINSGKILLVEEFGKEYGVYFSILELIASGKTSRPEIESILQKNVGGYMARLENDYAIISKHRPLQDSYKSRLVKYKIIDNFLNFWFRFIYSNRQASETGNFGYIRQIIKRDYSTYSGKMLERFYQDMFIQSGKYNQVGALWDTGNLNEIDLVAINDIDKKLIFSDIKLKKDKLNISNLKRKSENYLHNYSKYIPEYLGLSLEEIIKYLK